MINILSLIVLLTLLTQLMETTYQEIKRLEIKVSKQAKELKATREKVKEKKKVLHDQMKSRKRTEYHEYTLEDLAPKPKVSNKVAREQKEASIRGLLHTSGVSDPSGVLQQIKEIQRPRKTKK